MEESLNGNEVIEEYIGMLQKEPSQELLAVVLTSIRRRMKQGGELIVPLDLEGAGEDDSLKVQIMQVEGEPWMCAFTSVEEELKGKNLVVSTFTASIEEIFQLALKEDVKGVILNPWHRTIQLDKDLIRIIQGA